jgi:glycosyltransferase involved in cell wall biosynthesis
MPPPPVNNSPLFSIVVAVYGCAICLEELTERLNRALTPLSENYEILLVDDRSLDDAWSVIRKLTAQDNRIKGIRFSRNFGHHNALTAGLEYARGRWIVLMDCDLQDRPEEIQTLYRKAEEGYDIVYAVSEFRGSRSWLMKWFRKTYFYLYDFLSNSGYQATNLSFCILSSRVRDSFVQLKESSRHISSLLRYLGYKITGVSVVHEERSRGKSSYTWTKRFQLAYDGLIAYSSRLLKISFVMGILFSFFAFLLGGYLIINWIRGQSVLPGWTSLMVFIAFSAGMILISVGIVGMYLEKVYLEVKHRPLYIVDEVLNVG